MADFQVDSKLFALLFVCCLFFSCSSSKIKINKCENSNQWFVLDLKESKMYFNIKDVLDNIPKKKLNNEVLMKNYERIKISKDSILVAKDFYCQNQNVSENETMNFVILSESMLGLIKEGKLKVYNKKKLIFEDEITLKKFKPRLGSFGYNVFIEDKTKIYSIFVGITE